MRTAEDVVCHQQMVEAHTAGMPTSQDTNGCGKHNKRTTAEVASGYQPQAQDTTYQYTQQKHLDRAVTGICCTRTADCSTAMLHSGLFPRLYMWLPRLHPLRHYLSPLQRESLSQWVPHAGTTHHQCYTAADAQNSSEAQATAGAGSTPPSSLQRLRQHNSLLLCIPQYSVPTTM